MQRLNLSIAPGKHLGWLRLGMSLWDIIRTLRDQAALIPNVELKYSEEEPFSADIVLRLKGNGIELHFEPQSQRLKLIVIDDFSGLLLTYQGGEVSSARALPTFLLAYKLFGPTYPGEFDGTKQQYTLSYPGLSLVFPIPEKHMLLYQSSADLPLEFPDGTTPVASHMYIFYGADWTSAMPPSIAALARNIQESGNINPPSTSKAFDGSGGSSGVSSVGASGTAGSSVSGGGKGELDKVFAQLGSGVVLHFAIAPAQQQRVSILLHITTPQDLLADIGPPASVYYKEEDKMKIHSDGKDSNHGSSTRENQHGNDDDDNLLGVMDDLDGGRGGSSGGNYDQSVAKNSEYGSQPNDYFFNYFHLGMDVLFDGSTHRCKKIVLHANIPGHFDFQSYKRCPFVLSVVPPSSVTSSANISPALAKLPPLAPQQQPPSGSPAITATNGLASQGGIKIPGKTKKKATSKSDASGSHNSEGGQSSPELSSSEPSSLSSAPLTVAQQSPTIAKDNFPTGNEKGITPDMKISTMMAMLEAGSRSPSASSSSASPGPHKPSVILNRGSSAQNPFGPTMLSGCDGAVFEAMRNGHVASVILY